MTPSLTQALMSELLGGQTPQDARPVVGEGQTPTLTPATPPQPASEPQAPKRWRTLRTPDGQRPSPRQAQRDARMYAEQWYQALRDWEWKNRGELVPRDLAPKCPPKRQMTPVVGNWAAGDVMLPSVRVRTPIGWVNEFALARRCNEDKLLSEVRRGAGLATLHHASGRGWAGKRAREYGYAVLVLAHNVGDTRAADLLHLVFAEDSDTLSVELPE